MSHGIFASDIHYALIQSWHNLSKVVPEINAELFPSTVLRRLLAQPTREEIANFLRHGNVDAESLANFLETRHSGYSVPFQGNSQIGVPINPETYTVRDIRNLFDSVKNAMGEKEHKIVSAGTLFDRTQYFLSVEVPELKAFKVGGEEIQLFLNATGALDKTQPERYMLSIIRIVCNNTQLLSFEDAMRNPAGVTTDIKGKSKGKRQEVSTETAVNGARIFSSMRHSKNMADKVAATELLINTAIGCGKNIKAQFETLLAKPCSLTEAKAIYTGFLTGSHSQTVEEFNKLAASPDGLELSTRRKNEVAEITNLFSRGLGNKGETQFDLLNGLTQHYSRRDDLTSEPEACAKFVQSSTGGVYMDRKNDFLSMLLDRPMTEQAYERGKVILDRNGNGEVGDILGDLLAKDTGKVRSIGHVS
jgi:hypothetical protein